MSIADSRPKTPVLGPTARFPATELLNAVAYWATIIVVSKMGSEAVQFWPANAIAIALLVRCKDLNWAVGILALMAAGTLAVHMGSNVDWLHAIRFAGTGVAVIGAATWLLRHPLRQRLPVPHLTVDQGLQLGALFIFGFPALRALLLGITAPRNAATDVWQITGHAWLSGSVGACLFGPPIYLYCKAAMNRLIDSKALPENLALLFISAAITYLAISYVRFPFVVIGLPLIFIAFRLGAFGAACFNTVIGLLFIGLWSMGIRPHGLDPAALSASFASLPFPALAATLLGPLVVGLAIDDRREAERRLRSNERQFRQSIACSPIGMILADLEGAWTMINPALTQMLGYSEREALALPIGHVTHPDERAEVDRQVRQLKSGSLEVYVANRRYRHRDGTWVWVQVTVSLARDEHGNPQHIFAQIENIQQRLEAEARLLAERSRLEITLHALIDAVLTTDESGAIIYANPAAVALLRQPLAALEKRRLAEVLVLTDAGTAKSVPDYLPLCIARLSVVERKEPCLLHRPDGSICHILETVSPVVSADGGFLGAVVVIRDATALQEQTRELNHRATHDLLTDLANRFGFETRARASLQRFRHMQHPSVILMLDLDRFKQINDQCGHAAGDAMLKLVARTLSGEVRDTDVVARLGGDEFVILLNGCDAQRAMLMGENILRAIHALRLVWQESHLDVGVSIGIAAASLAHEDDAAWLDAADNACYEAKHSGRGQMRVAADEASGAYPVWEPATATGTPYGRSSMCATMRR